MKRIKALSMFSGGGIAETYFEEAGIDVVVANELIEERANFYRANHPKTKMVCGDITDKLIYNKVINLAKEEQVKFLIATPPCQGMSTLGLKQYYTDSRNSLFYYALNAIDELLPDFILFENVPKFLQLKYRDGDDVLNVV